MFIWLRHFFCCHIYLLLLGGGVWRRAVSPAVVEEVSAEDILQLCEGVFSFTRLQLAFPQDDGVPSQLMESGAGDGVAFCVARNLLCPVLRVRFRGNV